MNTAKKKKTTAAERGCAWAAAFLLTVFLFITLLSSIGLQMLTSAELHLSVAADEGMLDKQLEQIYAGIDQMAQEYGFSAEKVKSAITREELREINRQSAEWWTHLLTEGEGGTIPRWKSRTVEDIIYTAAEKKELREEPLTVLADLADLTENTVFPMRETTLAFGTKLARDKADIRGIIRSVRKLPLLGLIVSLVFAGLIALLTGREIFLALKYYGTAAAATGLSIATVCILAAAARPGEIIAEASAGLAGEFGTMAAKIGTGAALAAAILLAAGYLCLILYRRKAGKENNSTSENAG